MPLILSGNVASATAGVYEVANSCRFNDGDSPRLHRTLGTATDVDKWTFSCWFKRGVLSATQYLFYGYASGEESAIVLKSDDTIDWYNYFSSSEQGQLVTNRKFRDVGAWYHLVCAYDSDNGTAGNRMRMYINGTEETSFATDTNPASDENSTINKNVLHNIGMKYSDDGSGYFDGYLAEVCFVDGQQLTPSSFGEFDDDTPTVFKPKDVSGLTFGDNGAYLDFEDSDNLGDDESGNTNDWTEANLAATDQCTDSPTNNFCTLNSLATGSYNTLSEGNLMTTGNTASDSGLATTTIPFAFGGKWYWEMKIIDGNLNSNSGYPICGIFDDWESVVDADLNGAGGAALALDVQVQFGAGAGQTLIKPGTDLSITAPADDDIIMFAIDRDNNKFYMGNNGTWFNSGDPTTGATGTGSLMDLTANTITMFGIHEYNGSDASTNFGSPTYANSSDAADANGYGAFEYAPPSGYYALCTKNLAEYG